MYHLVNIGGRVRSCFKMAFLGPVCSGFLLLLLLFFFSPKSAKKSLFRRSLGSGRLLSSEEARLLDAPRRCALVMVIAQVMVPILDLGQQHVNHLKKGAKGGR